MGIKNTLRATKRNIKRNKFLSFSTIFVITIVFTISSLFIISSLIAREGIKYYETRAQVMVFFDKETPEEEIIKFKERIEDSKYIEDIEYVSQEKAFELYRESFKDDEELIETITASVLPPSLNVRATSVENLNVVIAQILEEKEVNPYIEEILFLEDVIEVMQNASTAINYVALILIPILLFITFVVVSITIGFNVTLHNKEIEIMHLVGSEDSFIKWPFRLEGMFYGMMGGLLSAGLILTPWYLFLYQSRNSDLYMLIQQTFSDFNLNFVTHPNLPFILTFVGLHVGFGLIIGYIASTIGLIKHLNLKKA
jgi:cell division transport system permease protein